MRAKREPHGAHMRGDGHEHGAYDTHGSRHGPATAEHRHDHGHRHPSGIAGVVHGLFVPHSHDPADAIDDALEADSAGIRAVKVSLAILLATTTLQGVVVAISGSVALLADTVHNFADALTAVPLWIAFAVGRRAATRRYTYGWARAEDLAGLFIVVVVALSAVLAAWQSVERILDPRPLDHLEWVLVAGVIGFAGNEIVAVYRIRVGRRIGSAALVADGVHARADGFTSLAVVVGAIGVLVGFPLADPVVGLLISAAIIVLLVGTVRSIGRRLLDGIEPELVDRTEHALAHVSGIARIDRIRLRWVGHRLQGDAVVSILPSAGDPTDLAARGEESVKTHLRNVDDFVVRVRRVEDARAVNPLDE